MAPATVPDPATVTFTARSAVDATKSGSVTATIISLSGPSRTFVFDHSLVFWQDPATLSSFFTLYDNGAFVLEYPAEGVSYPGAYSEANGAITFAWENWNSGAWGAIGTLGGNSLTVNFNQTMQLMDFVPGAVYTLRQTTESHATRRLLPRGLKSPNVPLWIKN